MAHEPPSLEVSQFRKVTEHAREIHPDEWIDSRNVRAAKAKVDASGAGFERGGCIVEGGSADAEHANALSRKSAKLDVIGRMGITLRGEVGDKVPRSPPASAAVKASCEDDLSRMDAFGPSRPTQMGEQKVAGRLDRCDFDLVFDWKLENIAVPIEICSPYLLGESCRCGPMPVRPNFASYQARTVRLGMPKSMPATSLGVRSSVMRAKRRQGPSSPRGLRSTILMLVIRSSFRPNAVASPLWPAPTISTSRTRAPSRERGRVHSRGRIAQIGQLAPHPIRELGNAHGRCPLTRPQMRHARSPPSSGEFDRLARPAMYSILRKLSRGNRNGSRWPVILACPIALRRSSA